MTTNIFARNVKDEFLQLTKSVSTVAVLMLSIFAVHVVGGCFSGHWETAAESDKESVREVRIVSILFGRELEVWIFEGVS